VSVNQAVHCTDQSVDVPSPSDIDAAITAFGERSPYFFIATLPFATCAGWHIAPNPVPRLTAPDAPPLLLIVGEHDILTPARVGAEMRASLASAVLVSSAHYGHGAILASSACIDSLLDDFFTRLELPEDGTRCP
jgi:pimeloyl-ACP methyl ester carboxylesterase